MNSLEDIPAAISRLIDAAVVAFDGPSASRGELSAWQLNRVIDYIETHLAEKIMAMDLADLINVSVGQLIRAFKISVGVPPFHYIASRRVELACTIMK
jgi:AraC family transcriptional regulator